MFRCTQQRWQHWRQLCFSTIPQVSWQEIISKKSSEFEIRFVFDSKKFQFSWFDHFRNKEHGMNLSDVQPSKMETRFDMIMTSFTFSFRSFAIWRIIFLNIVNIQQEGDWARFFVWFQPCKQSAANLLIQFNFRKFLDMQKLMLLSMKCFWIEVIIN